MADNPGGRTDAQCQGDAMCIPDLIGLLQHFTALIPQIHYQLSNISTMNLLYRYDCNKRILTSKTCQNTHLVMICFDMFSDTLFMIKITLFRSP